ncbi:hypothetical protein ACFRK5_25100 [Streptomyces niveus]|uniref:hypothetical protein n=1 Tax=Streptomyces niveus TaxID=193462 RepID=UPI0036B70498
MTVNKVIRSTAIGVSALALAFFSFPATAQAAPAGALAKLSHATAASQLSNAGIGISSSGGCSNRNNPTCTSLDQVNSATIQGAITLKNASGCGLTVTGGTETGHASGTYSHWNGYKLDFSMTSCLSNYVTRNFTSIGGSKWQSGAGNIYYNEVNHWDVTFYNCGGC